MKRGRPRTPIGTFGEIAIVELGDRYRATARFRDVDGRLRRVMATASSRRGAQARLKVKLVDRAGYGDGGVLSVASPFGDLCKLWLEHLDLRDISEGTKANYRDDLRLHVRATFEHFMLGELTTSRVERFLKEQAAISWSRAKHTRTLLNQMFRCSALGGEAKVGRRDDRRGRFKRDSHPGHSDVRVRRTPNGRTGANGCRPAVVAWDRGHVSPRKRCLVAAVAIVLSTAGCSAPHTKTATESGACNHVGERGGGDDPGLGADFGYSEEHHPFDASAPLTLCMYLAGGSVHMFGSTPEIVVTPQTRPAPGVGPSPGLEYAFIVTVSRGTGGAVQVELLGHGGQVGGSFWGPGVVTDDTGWAFGPLE